MLKYLVPRFPLRDLPVMLGFAAIGSLIAGCYGIVHDQITYSIGPEYFTHFKFDQFRGADPSLGDRVFVALIGFLATWWVGLIIAWILARRMLPNQPRSIAVRKIFQGFYLGPDAEYSWRPALERIGVTDVWGFVRVGYIHNAGYLGGLVGLVLTYFLIRPEETPDDKTIIRGGEAVVEVDA